MKVFYEFKKNPQTLQFYYNIRYVTEVHTIPYSYFLSARTSALDTLRLIMFAKNRRCIKSIAPWELIREIGKGLKNPFNIPP